MASLLIVKGAEPGRRFALDADRIVLGRDPTCDVVILGTAVSRRHAVISRLQGKFYLEDGDGKNERSRNGTTLNNDAVPFPGRVLLKNEDQIKICDFVCSFHDGPIKKPLPAEMRREEPEPHEESTASTTVEASLSSFANRVLLETQPADKIKLLLDISTSLGKNLKVDTLLPEIANKLFELYRQADRCFIIFRDETSAKLIPKVIKTRRSLDETAARFSRQIVNRCLERGEAILSEDASADDRFVMSQSIADFRIRSVMCAPLLAQDEQATGVIQLDTQDRNKKFKQDDLSMLMGVASQASIALTNARLHEEQVANERLQSEMDLAREVQQKFLPAVTPSLPHYQFFAHYDAAQQVGGDYYDFIPVLHHRVAVMLGDVAGKGVPAALLMARLSSDARFCMLTENDPAAAFRKLNSMLHQSGLTDRFVTLISAVLDPLEHTVALVNAGHMSPLVYRRAKGECEDAMSADAGGVPLAVHEEYPYEACRVQLDAGDSIVLFSDGVTDAMDVHNQAFQMAGVCATVKGDRLLPSDLGQRLVQAVNRHAAGHSQHDDITLVCFGRVD
jgi:serine phosphatase RsbU (regulator of sigma subunit)/pSer/pThr/pTyr-binding forkhead associated (FHA) protein